MTKLDVWNCVKTPLLNSRPFLEKICFVGRVGQEVGGVAVGDHGVDRAPSAPLLPIVAGDVSDFSLDNLRLNSENGTKSPRP